MNITEIKAAADSYMHRTDLTSKWATFIPLAEAVLFRELDLKDLEVVSSITSSGGYITLPADFGRLSRLTYTSNSQEVNVNYIDRPDSYVGTTQIGYSQENGKLRVFPDVSDTTYKLYYLPNISPLTDTMTTNWLSINAPDLYIYAICLEAAKWVRDGDQIQILSSQVSVLLDSVKNLSKRRALPSNSNLQVRIKPPLV